VIIVAGTVALEAGQRNAAIRVARTMAAATVKEPGCLRYRFYADLDDEHTFFVYEEWESEEALARHFQTEHMRAFQAELPALVAGALDIRRYAATALSAMT
jgi:quinol monooxygenase YgiN